MSCKYSTQGANEERRTMVLLYTEAWCHCSCKFEKMTRMAADFPAWPSGLKLGVNLVASTFKACHLFPYSSHTGASVSWIEISSGYSSLFPAILVITRTHPPLAGVAELLSTSLYQRRRRCYQGLWSISFVPINMHRRWPREWKRSIQLVLQQNKSGRSFFLPVVPYLNLIRNPEPGKILFVALESEIQH